jgi:hypothetical protein
MIERAEAADLGIKAHARGFAMRAARAGERWARHAGYTGIGSAIEAFKNMVRYTELAQTRLKEFGATDAPAAKKSRRGQNMFLNIFFVHCEID